jgi:hypothetical protein
MTSNGKPRVALLWRGERQAPDAGPKTPAGEDSYVLCEINVSAVLPIPDEAPAEIARCVARRLARA